MELRNALFRAALLRKRIRYSIAAPSQVKVILPSSPPANPNSSCDILRSSLNTSELRYTNGTSKRLPSAEYTTQWPCQPPVLMQSKILQFLLLASSMV
jgi:hypothetical protein